MNDKAIPSYLWHAPSEMQVIEQDGTPKNEMKKDS